MLAATQGLEQVSEGSFWAGGGVLWDGYLLLVGGLPKYRVKKGGTIYRKVGMPSSIRTNYCTDLLLLTSRKKSVRGQEKSNTCKLRML